MNLDSIDHCHAVVGSSPKVMGVNGWLDLCSHTMLPNFFHGHNLSIYLLLLRLNVMLDSYLNKNKSKYETWITGNVLAERQNKSVLLLCMTPSFLEHHVAIKELTVILICVFFVFDLHFLCGVFFVLSVFFHFSA